MKTYSTYQEEYPVFERQIPTSCRSKIKSHTPASRKAEDYFFTYHAIKRMEKRGLNAADVRFLLQNGRGALLPERMGVFLCQGEIPKRKSFLKTFARLQDAVVVVEEDQPLVITVMNNWNKREKLIYGATVLINHLRGWYNGGGFPFDQVYGPYEFKKPSDLLYTFASVQQKEIWHVSSAEISRIVRHGRRHTTARYLYLYKIRELTTGKHTPALFQGTAIAVELDRPLVVDIFRFIAHQHPSTYLSARTDSYQENTLNRYQPDLHCAKEHSAPVQAC